MANPSFAAPVGEILDGKFRVTKEIGRGGMATVYAAVNVGIGKPVAVKILSEELTTSKTVNERFLREARAAAKIQSPYICEVYDVGTYAERPFIVMELLEGESLYDRLSRERQLPVAETVRIAIQTAKGLKKAHELKVVHRDLKPENIFLTQAEDGGVHTKLVDFGLAKFYEPNHDQANARLTKEGALFGTPAYMSPEQAKGMGTVDHRSDLWALGCIVFEMLTGRTVWDLEQGVAMILAQIAKSDIPSARRYRPDLPASFDAWLNKALARDVEQRFQTADEFAASLQAALKPPSATPLPITPREPPPLPAAAPMADREGTAAATPLVPAPFSEIPAAPPKASRRRWVYAALAFAIGGGLGAWFVLSQLDGVRADGADQLAEQGPGAEQVAAAQAALTNGALDESLALLKQSFEQTQDKAVRSLLSHVSASKESAAGECELRGISHPRPFDSKTESSKLDLLVTEGGIVSVWADSTSGKGTTQAQLTRLDDSLRRIGSLTNVTPESVTTREPELFHVTGGAGLLYWDFDGDAAAAYARLLDASGELDGAPKKLSTTAAKHPFYPSITRDGEHYWAVWVEPSRDRVFDLFVAKLDGRLEPVSKPVAVTGYSTPVKGKTQADRPSISVAGDLLMVSYTLRRGGKQEVIVLRVPKDKVVSGQGVTPAGTPQTPNDEESDRFLGQAVVVSEKPNNHDLSTVRCVTGGCYVAWDDAQSSGHLAFMQPDGKFSWRRALGANSARPNIAVSPEGALVSWYDDKRIVAAPLSAAGPGKPSTLGRVSGVLHLPAPRIAHDPRAKRRWYVSWLTYETATKEPFVARMDCP